MAIREFTWPVNSGASLSTTLKANITSFGDGYEQGTTFGINNKVVNGQYGMLDKLPIIDAAYDFLIEHKGVIPFILTVAGNTKKFRTEGQITKNHVEYDVWQLSFTVKEVFIP